HCVNLCIVSPEVPARSSKEGRPRSQNQDKQRIMLARDGGARRAPTDLCMMVIDVATKEGSTSGGPCKTTANQPQISKRQRTPVTKKRKCSFQGCLGSAVSRGMDL
ncbi:hypothetical protein PF004_g27407, partial [Phytophthora fragariae]